MAPSGSASAVFRPQQSDSDSDSGDGAERIVLRSVGGLEREGHPASYENRRKMMRSIATILAVAAISCGTAASETNGRARSVSAQHAAFAQYETFSFGSADQ